MRIPDSKKLHVKLQMRAAGTSTPAKESFIDSLADSNIPVSYWFLRLSDFKGADSIKSAADSYCSHMDDNYAAGKNICFAGSYGTGKTYAMCSVLKTATIKGFAAYYTTIPELITYSSNYSTRDSFVQMISKVDFLGIDEIDGRHIPASDDAQSLFGSSFEKVLRYRVQNKMPMILATNHANPSMAFTGQYLRASDSLISGSSEIIPALGRDHRKSK